MLAAPQGFEPQYADSESAVLPLNEGAVQEHAEKSVLNEYIGSMLSGQLFDATTNSFAPQRHTSFFAQHLEWFLLQNAIRRQPSGDAG